MTLAELKQDIVNLESKLSSIDVPIRSGNHEIDIKVKLAVDKDGNIYADTAVHGLPGYDQGSVPLRRRIINMNVGDELEVSLDEYKATTVQNASSVLGQELDRRYSTRRDLRHRMINVIRLK